MSKYTQHGIKQSNWQDQQSVIPGVTKNGLVFIAILIVLVVAIYSLDWNWVFGLR